MINKTENDVRAELLKEILERLPNLDLTEGTPERDLFVEAPLAGQLMTLWQKVIYTAKLHAPHSYADDIDEADLTNYMENYNIAPTGETYSEGVVTFYVTAEPTLDITIPDNTIVKTRDAAPIEFATQGTYVMYQSIISSYYNANTSRWEINVPVRATVPGVTSVAGSNTVVDLATSVTGISGVTNNDPITGGAAAETVEDALDRVLDKFQGRGLGPTRGLINFIQPYVDAVEVVTANDPKMERDEGIGGAIDFYVIGSDLVSETDTLTITTEGLDSGVNVLYTSTGIILENQPVHEIVALIVNDVVISPNYYALSQDDGVLAKSTRSSDKVVVTSTGLQNGFFFKDSDSVEVNYIYNELLTTIEDDLNSLENHYENRDYLLREMTAVTITVYMEMVVASGQDFTRISSTVELAISDFINSIKNAGSVELADVVGVAKAYSTVDNINLTTVDITPSGGGTKTAQGDILLDKDEYPVAGAITLVEWAS